MAALEGALAGSDPGGRDLGALSSGPGALGGGRRDIERVRTPAWRRGADAPSRAVGRRHRAWRCLARQSPRQFVGAHADLAAGRTNELAGEEPRSKSELESELKSKQRAFRSAKIACVAG